MCRRRQFLGRRFHWRPLRSRVIVPLSVCWGDGWSGGVSCCGLPLLL